MQHFGKFKSQVLPDFLHRLLGQHCWTGCTLFNNLNYERDPYTRFFIRFNFAKKIDCEIADFDPSGVNDTAVTKNDP
jgi:hypothetical protein